MPKKKKVPVEAVAATTTFAYEGKVTIDAMKGNKVVKSYGTRNAGTMRLFNILCNFLVGQYSSGFGARGLDALLPNFISVGTELVNTPTDPLRTAMVNEFGGGRWEAIKSISVDRSLNRTTASFTAVLPQSTLTGLKVVTEIGLHSSRMVYEPDLLARIVIGADPADPSPSPNIGIELEEGLSLRIRWDIVIGNKGAI